jgi:hypothetical protein
MPAFGPWLPDLPPYGHDGLVTARNVYFYDGSYRPLPAPASFTSAIGAAWKGSGFFRGVAGNNKLLAGSDSGLYEYSGSSWALDFAAAATQNWYFDQFGDLVLAVNGGAPIKYTLATSTGANLAGSPPAASMVAVVDPGFVFLAGNSSNTNRLYWSGLEAPETWTIGTTQCDVQDIPDGGPITGLAGGEVGLVFQNDAIHEFAYVGPPTIFNRRKVSAEIGALSQGSIVRVGRRVYFYDKSGFYFYENGAIVPIGNKAVERTFRELYSTSDIINNLRGTFDEKLKLVIWSMPGALWIYSWADEGRWTQAIIPNLVGISTGATSGTTLEALDALFPGGLETVTPSLDDPLWAGGQPLILVALTDQTLQSLSGSNLEATLGLPSFELVPGRETHIRNVRLIGDAGSATVSIDARRRLNDAPINTSRSEMRDNGDMPVRSSGRYTRKTFTIPAGTTWSYVTGYEVEASAGGRL